MKIIFSRNVLVLCLSTFLVAVACTQSDPTPTPEPTPITTPIPAPTIASASTSTPAPTSIPAPTEIPEPPPTSDEDDITQGDYHPNTATITVQGETISFIGDIDIDTHRDFLDAVSGKEGQITTLRINSPGGVTDQGLLIGEWIFDHQIDVIVEEICFSSCANYIFTAGKNKIIEKDAIVGWHGSNQQDEHIARGYGISLEELWTRQYDADAESWGETPTESGRNEFVQALKEDLDNSIPQEKAFLEKIGVSVDVMVYGMLPDQFDYYMTEQTEFDGWTFSINDMAKFGINNVTYQGEGQYPSEKGLQNIPVAVFKVPADSVPPAVVPTSLPTLIPPSGSTPTPTPDPELESASDIWEEPPPADITVEGDTVVIDGYLNHNAFTRFRAAIHGKEDEITTVRINSDLGLPVQAILVGFWIYDNGVDVAVDGVCLSVCANYIFTAGKNKIIEDFAIVGWRDSPQRQIYEARSLGISVEELIRRDTSDDPPRTGAPINERERERLIHASVQYFETEIEQEGKFLDWIGLEEDALVYGFRDVDFDAEFLPLYLFEGWTFSTEDMARLGIENVTYNSDHEYPSLLSTIERSVTVFEVP